MTIKIPAGLLTAFDRAETVAVTINEGFKVTVVEDNFTNPLWAKRAAHFMSDNPDHPLNDKEKFANFINNVHTSITDKNTSDYIADVLIVGWECEEMPYSAEAARELLQRLPRIANNILTQAKYEANFRNVEVEEAVKK